jgi:serine/threonine protein kinase
MLFDELGHVKISDFGLSRFAPPNALLGTPCGSPCYASPELLSGRPYDGRTNDVWSVGVVLFAMVTGQLPWTKRNQAQLFAQIRRGEYAVPASVSPHCADLIRRLLTVAAADRITLAQAVRHPWLAGVPLQQTPLAQLRRISLRRLDECFRPAPQPPDGAVRQSRSADAGDFGRALRHLTQPARGKDARPKPGRRLARTPSAVTKRGKK